MLPVSSRSGRHLIQIPQLIGRHVSFVSVKRSLSHTFTALNEGEEIDTIPGLIGFSLSRSMSQFFIFPDLFGCGAQFVSETRFGGTVFSILHKSTLNPLHASR